MYNTKKIADDLFWVGANDRRLSVFEGVYPVPTGVSYNSYLLMDEKLYYLIQLTNQLHTNSWKMLHTFWAKEV